MKIAKESWVILAIGVADLITTIIFIKHQGAEEANPLFRRYWEMGVLTFVAAKIALLVGPLCILEWARRRNPAFVSWALRTAIAGYLMMYGVGVARLNNPARADAMINIAQAEASMPAVINANMRAFIRSRRLHHFPMFNHKGDPIKMQHSGPPTMYIPALSSRRVAMHPRFGAGQVIASDAEFAPKN